MTMLTYFELQSLLTENDPDHWLVNEDADLNDTTDQQLTELLDTGSVTITVGTRKVVVALIVQEET